MASLYLLNYKQTKTHKKNHESQTSYSVEQVDIFQCQSYSHSDDMFIILKSIINTDTSIFVFSREKLHDSKYSKYASPKP
jgi:Tfp pilus assembly pilus retraction ATPase PilT